MLRVLPYFLTALFFSGSLWAQSSKVAIGSDPNEERIGLEDKGDLSVMKQAVDPFRGLIPAKWLYSLRLDTDTAFKPSGKSKKGKARGRSGQGSDSSN